MKTTGDITVLKRWTGGPFARRADRPQPTPQELAASRYRRTKGVRQATFRRKIRREQE